MTFRVTRIKSIKDPLPGYQRQWVMCDRHGNAAYYDYVPYSLSNPIMTMPNCACSPHYRDQQVKCVEEPVALTVLARRKGLI